MHSLETTGTYKYKTSLLKSDGYDIDVISGNLYLINHTLKTYDLLTREAYDQIKKGEAKFR